MSELNFVTLSPKNAAGQLREMGLVKPTPEQAIKAEFGYRKITNDRLDIFKTQLQEGCENGSTVLGLIPEFEEVEE